MRRAWAFGAAIVAGCGDSPAVPEDSAPSEFIELQMPAVEIPAGSERLFCYFIDNGHGDVAIDYILGQQGPGGHHLALKAGGARRPNGAVEDCTDESEELHDLHFGGNLPADGAMLIPADLQLIVQTHYVNSTDAPLVVEDLLRLHRHTVTERTRLMSALHIADDGVVVDPGHAMRELSCTPPIATELVMLWGHMHGLGERFTISTGADVIYDQVWQPAYEVAPPRLEEVATPIVFRPDVPVTITCEWNNTSGGPVAFPEEMCGVGGYVLGNTPFWCGAR